MGTIRITLVGGKNVKLVAYPHLENEVCGAVQKTLAEFPDHNFHLRVDLRKNKLKFSTPVIFHKRIERLWCILTECLNEQGWEVKSEGGQPFNRYSLMFQKYK